MLISKIHLANLMKSKAKVMCPVKKTHTVCLFLRNICLWVGEFLSISMCFNDVKEEKEGFSLICQLPVTSSFFSVYYVVMFGVLLEESSILSLFSIRLDVNDKG